MQDESIRLPVDFCEHPLYPKKRFTKYEAFLDLLFTSYPTGQLSTVREYADRWRWPMPKTFRFLNDLTTMELLSKKRLTYSVRKAETWFDEGAKDASEQEALVGQVMMEFNRIMDRRVSLNDAKKRAIRARIREGARMKPPVGLKQFVAVFEFKKKEWAGSEMDRHLEIETLCAAKHFFKYLDQARDAFRKGDKTKLQEPAFKV